MQSGPGVFAYLVRSLWEPSLYDTALLVLSTFHSVGFFFFSVSFPIDMKETLDNQK